MSLKYNSFGTMTLKLTQKPLAIGSQDMNLNVIHNPPNKTMKHIALWQKSSDICNKYHPGLPPCFFPFHFAESSPPQLIHTFSKFVQQCPSSDVYRHFYNDYEKRNLLRLWPYHGSSVELLTASPHKVSQGQDETCIKGPESPRSLLSSVYSSLTLLDGTTPENSPLESENPANRTGNPLIRTSYADPHSLNLTKLSALRPINFRSYLAINIKQETWEDAKYYFIKSFTNELKELTTLVAEEIWEHERLNGGFKE